MVIAKKKDCQLAGEWVDAMVNQVWWIGASTPQGRTPEERKLEADMKQAKWDSMPNHMQNIHHHRSDVYPQCTHESSSGDSTKYMKPGMFNSDTDIYLGL